MTLELHSFIHLFFTSFIALFPVVNPIGSAFIVNPYFSGLTNRERISAVRRVALYAFVICVVTMFTGRWILALFGLSVPVVKLAGGIMICKIGWEFLSSGSSSDSEKKAATEAVPKKINELEAQLFYPITFPISAGAGTIAVLFTLSAHSDTSDLRQYLLNSGAVLTSIVSMCVLIFLFYVNANRLISFLGSQNE